MIERSVSKITKQSQDEKCAVCFESLILKKEHYPPPKDEKNANFTSILQ